MSSPHLNITLLEYFAFAKMSSTTVTTTAYTSAVLSSPKSATVVSDDDYVCWADELDWFEYDAIPMARTMTWSEQLASFGYVLFSISHLSK